MGGKEDKFDKYDEMGQLVGGYDVNLAREKALQHAKDKLSKNKVWLQGLALIWEILSAKFDEEEDCYKVTLECYPEISEIDEKSRWEYHIDVAGKLYAGTPRLVSRGKWIVEGENQRSDERIEREEEKQKKRTGRSRTQTG